MVPLAPGSLTHTGQLLSPGTDSPNRFAKANLAKTARAWSRVGLQFSGISMVARPEQLLVSSSGFQVHC